MIFPRCSTRRSLTAKIPRQPCDIDLDGSTRRRLAFWQYFPMRTLESKQLWLVNILHGSFANKAVLNNCISLSPKPPDPFGCVIFSQETQNIFFFPSFESHQKRIITDWIFLHKLMGNWKHDIGKVGMAEKTDWSRVSLLAVDRYLSVWPGDCTLVNPIYESR